MIAVHLENRRVELRRLPRPKRPEGHAIIRLLCGGICNTDLELLRGYYNFKGIPGHEFVGEVVAASNPVWLGRRVVGEINLACRNCDWCSRGLERHCPNRKVLGIVRHPGAFREFLTLPEANLHTVPDSIPTEAAVFTEPLAAACEVLDQVEIPAGAKVAVLGDGKLGLLISQVFHAKGFQVLQFGRHQDKLRIAAKSGVTTELAKKKLPQTEFDWVIDATGSAAGLEQAISMTRPRGTVFMKSTVHGSVRIDAAAVIVNEIRLVGSRCGRFEPALELLETGRINVSEMVSEEASLGDAPRAFSAAARKGALKILLKTT
jgi:threonine dehydrogenase-like Zn-dependent dehydrogenase